MSKIKTLHINNFKFFRNPRPIDLDGKHLLLYGENGSGKSSMYYGLYTLLESASKQIDNTQKYFDPNHSESLVNIYADRDHGAEHTGAYIQLTDTDNRVYRLSYSDTDCIDNPTLLESNRASDFINYVSLFQFQSFRNSEVADLRKTFLRTILPSVSFPSFNYLGNELKSAKEMYDTYKKGPEKTRNQNGTEILVYKNSAEYTAYTELESHFNRNMEGLIDFVNANVNTKITDFEYNFKVQLEYKNATHHKKDKSVDFTEFKILLRLIEYNGMPINNEHPNTFLNEARMAALAFSIRWSILEYRLLQDVVPEALKVLVLDDIMISLDMANRNKLIHIITSKLAKKFQIIFLTHDMMLFTSIKHELMRLCHIDKEEALSNTDWLIQEMYETIHEGIHEPILQNSESDYSRAYKYYKGDTVMVDHTASGNAIRQAIEGAFKELFRKANITRNQDGTPIDFSKLMIADCIDLARLHYIRLGLTEEFVNKVDNLRECLLNPASHDNPGRNFYSQEQVEAFEIYEKLCTCDCRVIIPKGAEVNFTIKPTDNVEHNYTVKLKQDLVAYKLIGNRFYMYYWDQGKFLITDSADPKVIDRSIKRYTLPQVYYESFDLYLRNGTFDKENIHPPLDAIYYEGKTLRELIVI